MMVYACFIFGVWLSLVGDFWICGFAIFCWCLVGVDFVCGVLAGCGWFIGVAVCGLDFMIVFLLCIVSLLCDYYFGSFFLF